MKRFTAILLALFIIFGLCACGGPKPEDTVKSFCEGMKSFYFAAMQACVETPFTEEGLLEEDA